MTSSVLGIDVQTGERVDIPKSSRLQGLYLIGIQGTGKSGLIENLILQDIKQDIGVCLLDPHGDLTHAVLSKLPDRRVQDVIYLDLTEYRYTFGINLFTCSDPSNPVIVSEAASKVMHIFKKLWGKGGIVVEDAWGVLLEEILWNATLTFLEASKETVYTMTEIPLLLEDGAFRSQVVKHITNRHVKNYWVRKCNPLSEKDQREETRSTLNRINAFLTQPIVEYIVGQAQTTMDFRFIMDQGKILLMKLSKRHEAVTALIGSMVIAGCHPDSCVAELILKSTTALPEIIPTWLLRRVNVGGRSVLWMGPRARTRLKEGVDGDDDGSDRRWQQWDD